jgi:hypothetical protein
MAFPARGASRLMRNPIRRLDGVSQVKSRPRRLLQRIRGRAASRSECRPATANGRATISVPTDTPTRANP